MRAATILVAALVLAGGAARADDRDSARSVVQVNCAMENGKGMKATGFVWPEPGKVVTALHAVAGCAEIEVYSEDARRSTLVSKVLKVNLEADLALLALDDDLGLAAVPIETDTPDTRGRFFAWGYPLAAEQMIDLKVEFGGGLKGGVTTIGAAFASDELDKLFRSQPYPDRDTQILRVTSTIQPGHSGAPIFDDAGAVVAIADGGLLGGTRGINWSIPAFLYLPGLPESQDKIPAGASEWAGLFSATVPNKSAMLRIPGLNANRDGIADEDAGILTLVRQVSLGAVMEDLGQDDDADTRNILRDIADYVNDDPALLDEATFDIFEDRVTGATVAVPSWMELTWNADLGAAEAYSPSGAGRMTIALMQGRSFDEALDIGVEDFVSRISDWADWTDGYAPDTFEYDEVDENDEWALYVGTHDGDDRATGAYGEMLLMITVSGNVFLGSSVYLVGDEQDLTDDDYFDDLMMQVCAEYLTDFALY
ncbi:MAG: trypsin-like peptidase domain-containing protein [Rhodobacteraceae bacterium]|nr:trypsin-like peptidase domain-containing protein [Paracoccaceae bacterium]